MSNNATMEPAVIESALATLQPIRDLAKNWDIDIASCLEEYLHELVDVLSLQEQEEGAEKLNFAQAALVLQNSSHIYSRKVEYLYSLVYKALDELCAGTNNNKSNSRKSKDADVDDFCNFDAQQEFLLLDDILPTDSTDDCRQINMPASQNTAGARRRSVTRLSMGSTTDKSMNGAAARALMGSLDTGSLRLVDGRCDISDNGWLLMPGSSMSARKTTALPEQQPNVPRRELDNENDFPTNLDDDDGHDNDGPGFAFADDEPSTEVTTTQSNKKHVSFAATVKEQPKKASPWELLDPHVPDKAKARPLKIGKTLRFPAGIDEPPSACVTGARTRRIARNKPPVPIQEKPIMQSLATRTFKATLAARKRSHNETQDDESSSVLETEMPTVPLKGLFFGDEFAYIAKANAKRKAAERRERRKLQQQQQQQAAVPDEEDEEEDGGGFAFAGDDDDDDFGQADFGDDGQGNTGMASVDEAYHHSDNPDDSNADAHTFEELCRAHLRAFAKGAEKYASETQLSRRVGHWQEQLVPVLEEEEKRPEFDIHVYGHNVIETMQDEIRRLNPKSTNLEEAAIRTVDFATVTHSCPRYEVCRMFLASLSLMNGGNVELGEVSPDGTFMELELLKTSIDQPMESYLAPSVRS